MSNEVRPRILLPGRAAFLVVAKPEQFQGQGDPRYSGNLIMEDEETIAKARKAMMQAARKQWGDDAPKIMKQLQAGGKTCLVDGNTREDYAGYEGNWIIQCNAPANQPPKLVRTEGGRNVELDRATQSAIYAGCYVNFLVEFWGQDNKWGKRLNAQLCGIQFVRNGDPFGGGKPADLDEFETIEGGDDSAGFGDDSEFGGSTDADDDQF